jgi:hypothetical protein
MPLSPPTDRRHLHTRQIICQGFERKDGLWDIEGQIIDTKTYDFPNDDRGGVVRAGESVHHMTVRITIDDQMAICDAEVAIDYAPFAVCSVIAPNFKDMIGMRIGQGFKKELMTKFGGRLGCTHVVELMGPIATTAFQTLTAKARKIIGDRKPPMIDRCHALASDGEAVAKHWPQWATPKDAASS